MATARRGSAMMSRATSLMMRPAANAYELSMAIARAASQLRCSIRTPAAICTAAALSIATGSLRGLGK